MNKNTTTYNLNEESLREVLGQYEAGFDEHHWEEMERRLDAQGLQRKTLMSGKAKKLGLLASLVVVGGLLAAFINLNKKTVVSDESTQAAFQTSATAEDLEILKIDSQMMPLSVERKSTMAEAMPAADTNKVIETAQQPENNEVDKVVQPAVQMKTEAPAVGAENNTDTAVKTVTEQPSKKKKKSRKKNADVINPLIPPPVTHSEADDELIISE